MYRLAVHGHLASSLKQRGHDNNEVMAVMRYIVAIRQGFTTTYKMFYIMLITYLFLPQLNSAPERDKAKL